MAVGSRLKSIKLAIPHGFDQDSSTALVDGAHSVKKSRELLLKAEYEAHAILRSYTNLTRNVSLVQSPIMLIKPPLEKMRSALQKPV